ncbi:hypothetical protein C0989_003811 [Termitomyces sp. Mn162]|nr:hypothetical protein C0989_003811 [Termitomyces sp. Mn162]
MVTDINEQFLRRISLLEWEMLEPSFHLSSFEDFNGRWTSLVDDLTASMDADLLSSSTITTAYALSQKVTLMVDSLRNLDVLCAQLMSSLLDETSSSPNTTFTDVSNPINIVPYIKPSYDWLLKNLHNPYPPTRVRESIAQKSGATRKDVDNWFIDVRKRIGWNAARKYHFSNKRADIVDAATRFFSDDERLSLSQGAEHALISIMKNAKDLYCDKFDETILATKLASVVKDLTPASKAEAKAERLRQTRLKKDRNSYPSPDRSPGPSRPSPVPCDDVDTVATQIFVPSRKRRNTSAQPTDPTGDEGSRPEKRLRLEASLSSPESGVFLLGLPSPAPSIDESPQAIEPNTVPSLPSPASVPASRKRHLSESDSQVVPKRPCHLPAGVRSQVVSNPLPLSNTNLLSDETSFDGWFQQIFDHPEAGPSGFSVELGKLSDFQCLTPVESRSTSPKIPEQTSEPPTLEVAGIPAVLDVPWNEFDFGWTDNSSNNLGQSNSLVNFVGQAKPLAQDLVNFQVPSQISRPVNNLESFFGLSNPSLLDPVVLPLNLASDETWNLSDSTVNRDDANVVGKHNADFSSNDLLASFDFSQGEDFLPSRSNAISLPAFPQGKARQEKEKEFRETYEKAQRLALELQRDDLLAL